MTDSNQQSELSKEQIDSVITLYTAGQYQEAINQIKILNQSYPNTPFLFNLIGACYKSLGQLEGSAKMFETAVNLKPDYAEAHKNLGITLKDLGQLDAAVGSLSKAIAIDPSYVDAHYNLAITFKDLNQLDAAVKSYQKVIEINPNFAQAYNNLGNLMKDLGQADVAIKNYQKAIEINPSFAHAYNNLGSTLMSLGRLKESILSFEKAISLDPRNILAHNNLGTVLSTLGQLKAGVKSIEKALEIDSDFAEAHNSLGNIYRRLKQREKALLCYERAYAIKPDMNFVLGSLINIKMHLCIWSNLESYLEDLTTQIKNNKKVIGSFNLFGLIDDSALHRKTTEIRINSAHPRNTSLPAINPYPRRSKIRIGYFSADFKIHPVTTLTAELYEVHNRERFEIHAFSYGPDTNDAMNLRIKAGVDHFHNVEAMSHKDIALLARSLEIDIAVDLTGYTAKSRTDIFAMSAAPIQLSYIGFLGTMAADYYDYLIADPVMIPKESQQHYAEKIVYLPSFQVNDSKDLPPDITLTRQDVGLPETGFVFCCFNNTWKITPEIFDSWARILNAVEDSVLIIYIDNKIAEKNLIKEIKIRSINPNRLIFADRYERPEYLARYRVADLFLDTHPYNAGTTASDALKMGLPLITMQGESFNSREAASILTSINLPELITHTPKEYEALAIDLATHPEKLKVIKDKLADNLSTAPLFDTKRFTKNIESAYTQMYERSQQGLEPDHIYV
jgi:predicted O-linked N-acetylglucosamine transferase (SPINDLY family)